MPKIAVPAYLFSAGDVEEFDRHPEFDVLILPRQRG
jgi:hypothetical protein